MSTPSSPRTPRRIGFLTAHDPWLQRAFSGTTHRMFNALRDRFEEVVPLGPHPGLDLWNNRLGRINSLVRRVFPGRRIDFDHSLFLAAVYSRHFNRRLREERLDAIYASASSTELAGLRTDLPVVYGSDTTIGAVTGYYPSMSNILGFSRWEGNLIEARALRKARLVTYSSEWARQSALRDYGQAPEKVRVIPYGANIDAAPPRDMVEAKLAPLAPDAPFDILFLGVDWERKGGDICHRAFLRALEMGVPARLTVVGCQPPPRCAHPRMEVHTRLSKHDPEQYRRFLEILARTRLMVVPTRADCTPIAFCEAAAYGIPVLSTATGGVPSVVVDGVNGFCLPLDDRGDGFAERIAGIHRDAALLETLVRGARRRYEETLNWAAWGSAVHDLLVEVIEGKDPK